MVFLSVQIQAQYSNAIFFSENGERFHVILNGINYSENAETNVKVLGLNAQTYNVRVIFSDTALGVITDKIYMDYGKEKTYNVKLRKIGETEKSLKKIQQNLLTTQKKETTEAKIEEINKTSEKYVLRLLSVTEIETPAPEQKSTQQSNQKQTQPAKAQSSVDVATTHHSSSTTTTVKNAPPAQSNANVSFNLNVGGTGSHSESTSTTVTTSGTANTAQTNVYEMPGYNGPVGCPWPMTQQDFLSAKNSIASKNFEDSKLTMAKQIMNTNCLFSSQVKEIMLLFSFEGTRLDLAKYGYGYTFDIGNYYKVNDAFTYESSIDELNEYINKK